MEQSYDRWGSGDEKLVARNFELLFNGWRSEDQAKDPDLPPALAKQKLAWAGGQGAPFQEVPPPPSWKVSLRLGSSTQ